MRLILSTLLFFCGLGIGVAVVLVSLIHLAGGRRRLVFGAHALMGCGYGGICVYNLIRQSSGVACAMTPISQLAIFGGLLLLHIFFLIDGIRTLPKEK